MIIGKTLYVTQRNKWRKWLSENFNKEAEIWLIYYKKETGKARIPYNDAVEEALCYGWIDSTVKKIDEESFAQRFSPRRKTSILSEMNRQRIEKLIAQKKMTKAGMYAIAHVFDSKKEELVISSDILKAIKANGQAWKNFQKLPENYVRIRILYIEDMRKQGKEMFEKSLNHFIKKTAKNKRYGFVREML